jgi:TDG/mug DNA glycosylase family protein
MATEFIDVAGDRIETLKELLQPGLGFIVVGLNPSPKSVLAGHYYQGVLGQSFLRRLQTFGIVGPLPRGREDDAAFGQGIGFADLY